MPFYWHGSLSLRKASCSSEVLLFFPQCIFLCASLRLSFVANLQLPGLVSGGNVYCLTLSDLQLQTEVPWQLSSGMRTVGLYHMCVYI